MRNFLSKVFIIFGILILLASFYLVWVRTNPGRLSFDNFKPEERQINANQNMPVKLAIPELNIDLPVLPSNVVNNKWEATTKGVSYLVSSPIPGEVGNSILFGHNWPNLLGKLINVKPGQKILIEYSNGTKKTFEIQSTAVVKPNQAEILDTSKDIRITLYTCTGLFDLRRFVVVAKLQK